MYITTRQGADCMISKPNYPINLSVLNKLIWLSLMAEESTLLISIYADFIRLALL